MLITDGVIYVRDARGARVCPHHQPASESRFLCRGYPPGRLNVLDDGISNEPYTTVSLALERDWCAA